MSIQRVIAGEATWHVETCDVLHGLGQLPDNSVQCAVTSPPYWGLRDYGVDGQLGLEKTPREFVDVMVVVFEQVRRVLRGDGTLWLNIGDSYAAGRLGRGDDHMEQFDGYARRAKEQPWAHRRGTDGCKPKDLVGVPWLLAFALREAGWYLRSEIIWHKRSPMPESVRDRPTKSHEQIFLFSKSPRYFYDAVASAEPVTGNAHSRGNGIGKKNASIDPGDHKLRPRHHREFAESVNEIVHSRNMRTVWSLSSEPFSEAHFATYPTELVRRCLLAGTSARRDSGVPDLVLDPFNGAGTTGVVARRLGLRYLGLELNPEYAAMSRRRIADDQPLLNAS